MITVKISLEYNFSEKDLHIAADDILQVKNGNLASKYYERALRRAKTKFITELFKLAANAENSFNYEVITQKDEK